jgi:hypothetical protein
MTVIKQCKGGHIKDTLKKKVFSNMKQVKGESVTVADEMIRLQQSLEQEVIDYECQELINSNCIRKYHIFNFYTHMRSPNLDLTRKQAMIQAAIFSFAKRDLVSEKSIAVLLEENNRCVARLVLQRLANTKKL